jgi:hypothetical protein
MKWSKSVFICSIRRFANSTIESCYEEYLEYFNYKYPNYGEIFRIAFLKQINELPKDSSIPEGSTQEHVKTNLSNSFHPQAFNIFHSQAYNMISRYEGDTSPEPKLLHAYCASRFSFKLSFIFFGMTSISSVILAKSYEKLLPALTYTVLIASAHSAICGLRYAKTSYDINKRVNEWCAQLEKKFGAVSQGTQVTV